MKTTRFQLASDRFGLVNVTVDLYEDGTNEVTEITDAAGQRVPDSTNTLALLEEIEREIETTVLPLLQMEEDAANSEAPHFHTAGAFRAPVSAEPVLFVTFGPEDPRMPSECTGCAEVVTDDTYSERTYHTPQGRAFVAVCPSCGAENTLRNC